jgi:hypothetical protein
VEIPILGEGGEFESKWIRLADLKGNIQAHPEADESFPRLKSQQRAVIQQLMATPDPIIQRILLEPDNLQFIKSAIGLTELVIPDEDSRNKQLREIQQLVASAPTVVMLGPDSLAAQNELPGRRAAIGDSPPPGVILSAAKDLSSDPAHAAGNHGVAELPSVPIDKLLDDHAVEFEVCKRWASSDAGQTAKMENPLGFANVRAHAAAHLAALQRSDDGVNPPLHSVAPALRQQH